MSALILPSRRAYPQNGPVALDRTSTFFTGLRYFVITKIPYYNVNLVDNSPLSVTVEAFATINHDYAQTYDDALGGTSGQIQYTLSTSSWVGSYAVSHHQNGSGSVPWMFASTTAWDGLYADNAGGIVLTSNSGFGGSLNSGISYVDGPWQRNCISIVAANNFRAARNASDVSVDASAALPITSLSKLILGGDYSQGNQTSSRTQYFAIWDRNLSDAEMRAFNADPWQMVVRRPRILYFPSAGGGGAITGTGSPAAQSATVSGTATRTVTGSGTPTAQAATAAGTAEREITSSGTPAAQSATVSGTGTVGAVVTGSGSPQAQSATVAGMAERTVTASGTVAAQSATVAGTAEREITSSGTPTAQSATVVGTGQVGNIISGSGTPTAQSATVSGAAEREITASGTVAASSATVAGTAERTITGTGTLSASSATVYGFDSAPVSGNPTSGGGTGKVYSSKKLRKEVDEWLEKQQESERQKFLARLQREDEELMVIMLALAA